MTINGSEIDRYKIMHQDFLEAEAAQKGSILEIITDKKPMSGQQFTFDTMRKLNAVTYNSRGEPSIRQTLQFQRRSISQVNVSSTFTVHDIDLTKYVNDPTNEAITVQNNELALKIDAEIVRALKEPMTIIENGSSSTASLTLTVAKDDHAFDPAGGTGAVGLTTYKIINAQSKIQEVYGKEVSDRLFLIAGARQLANLTKEDKMVNFNYSPRKVTSLDDLPDFLGIKLIPYEGLGLDSNGDPIAFLVTEKAIQLGVWKNLTVDMQKDLSINGAPLLIQSNLMIGAGRKREESVVQISCATV